MQTPAAQQDVDLASHWAIDPGIAPLNHGSFGACPREVLAEQQDLRGRMEANTNGFFRREIDDRLDAAREAVAGFVGASADGFAFVLNATTGVNAVVRSLAFEAGDELLTTDHDYFSCVCALRHAAERSGAKVVVAPVPVPIGSPAEVIDRVLHAVSERTKLAMLSHITSGSAAVLPIAELVRELEGRGIAVLVDGAHAPGQVEVDIGALGASYYAANCHKWICSPKGSGFLWVREDRREGIHPTVISQGWAAQRGGRTRYHDEFDWTGTFDPTASLCVPKAIEVVGGLLDGGWEAVRAHNRGLAQQAGAMLVDRLGGMPTVPPEMRGAMFACTIPGMRRDCALGVQDRLATEFGVEVPVLALEGVDDALVRISAQLYNRFEQYERLADALDAIRAEGER